MQCNKKEIKTKNSLHKEERKAGFSFSFNAEMYLPSGWDKHSRDLELDRGWIGFVELVLNAEKVVLIEIEKQEEIACRYARKY